MLAPYYLFALQDEGISRVLSQNNNATKQKLKPILSLKRQ